jgi:uncharacterized alkaline shock family protein YloU
MMMSETPRPPGKTTIAPDVLLAIARLATLGVDGVSHMSARLDGLSSILKPGHHEHGVEIELNGNVVNADLYVVLDNDVNLREVSRNIQDEVARAISEMAGMKVGKINVHIEDIYFNNPE